METLETIHRFWFGPDAAMLDDAEIGRRQARLWWAKHANIDAEIRERFGKLITQAASGSLDHWMETGSSWLALILLTDQFPRNAWRDSPEAFACDAAALRFCCVGLDRGMDGQLRPIERVFAYLPLEHSENLPDQDEAVRRFKLLKAGVPADQQDAFNGYLDFARRHHAVIERFGRFPHRNQALGRTSTPEEIDFLRQPGSRF